MASTREEDHSHQASDGDVISRAFWKSLIAIGLAAAFLLLVWRWSQRPPQHVFADPASPPSSPARTDAPHPIPRVLFVDVTRQAGITFVGVDPDDGENLFPETMGGGGGFIDYDGDGDFDILLINMDYWPWAQRPHPPARPAVNLYRNEGNWRFTDVTAEAGFTEHYFGLGLAVGDYDGDGDPDLYVTALGPNHLYRNDGGRFRDVTELAGVAGNPEGFSTSCGWLDYDRDGDLDLFVCEYVKWSRQLNLDKQFRMEAGVRAHLPPEQLGGDVSRLYRNEGRGVFSDVTAEAGLEIIEPDTKSPVGKALGCVFRDLDDDGWPEIVVANDSVRNFCLVNQRNGTFREVGQHLGIAYGPTGLARAGMGIDLADFRNNGTHAIAIGNFSTQMMGLYVSRPFPDGTANWEEMRFADEAVPSGIGGATRLSLTFGLFFFDYDLDGRLDLLAANGHVDRHIEKSEFVTFQQPPQLFWNCGPQAQSDFAPVRAEHSGPDLFRPMVGRSASFADLDADGDLDVLIAGLFAAPRLLRNDNNLGHNWLRLKLRARGDNREALGARIDLLAGGTRQRQYISPTRSYLAQCEPVATFGLGRQSSFDEIVIRWPSGKVQVVKDLELNRLHVLDEPEGP